MTHKPTDAARDPWRDSLRSSRERRAAATRARRWTLRRRTTALFASAAMVCGGGVALAQGDGGTSTGGGAQAETEAAQETTQTLRPGDTGVAVKRLQRKLKITADGHYGRMTKRAVKRFQKRAGIKADGIAGPDTLARLGVRVATASTGGGSGSSDVEVPAVLQRIAECESGGNPRAVSPDGTYRGKYQFDQATWEEWGGTGDPIDASEAVQDRIAIKLYKARGTTPWPTCGG